mgnify:FL=1
MINEYEDLDIYKIKTDQKLNKKKIAILVLCILILICLIITIKHTITIMKGYKIYKQYETQLQSLKYQDEKEQQKKKEEEEKAKQAKIPKLTEEGKNNVDNIYKSDTKRAFLTFDDGPSEVTNQILDTLKQEKVKATFFVLGSNVKTLPNVVKRIYDEGHYIANHGYSHVYSKIYASPQTVLDEFNQCNDAVKEAIQVPEYNSHLFRFPGGLAGGKYATIKNEANELLKQNEVMHVDWNSLTGDAETNNLSIEFELQRLRETSEGKNSLIILMHDAQAKKTTADALPNIIAYLKEQGYKFESFYNIIK